MAHGLRAAVPIVLVLSLVAAAAAAVWIGGAWVNPNAMAAGPHGIAVGNMGDGLLIGDGKRRAWRRLTTASGLPSDDATAVAWSDGQLWVGTRAGIAEVRWLESGSGSGSGSPSPVP